MTVAETIQKITREHLKKNNGLALGQCLTAVGWVGGTVPELTQEDGLVELSMADVSGGGIAVGVALAGRRPIYIIRYQGFNWYNAPFIVNYAAKAKEMWGTPCPIFVRSIAMDGLVGPTTSGSHHGIFTRMPGMVVAAPMTPKEYEKVWDHFMSHDDPVCVSEHRRSFPINYEMEDVIHDEADITLFPISSTRLNAVEAVAQLAKEGIKCNIVHILWLKPFVSEQRMVRALSGSRFGGIVLDGDYENSVAKCIAFDLMRATGSRVSVLCREDRTGGYAPNNDNLPPITEKIFNYVKKLGSEFPSLKK